MGKSENNADYERGLAVGVRWGKVLTEDRIAKLAAEIRLTVLKYALKGGPANFEKCDREVIALIKGVK